MKVINGDILTPNGDKNKIIIVCHQVNCMGVMGAGLALQIKNKFPDVYEQYKSRCKMIKKGIGGLGDVQYCSTKSGYIIANIFSQYNYGYKVCHTDYIALKNAFSYIAYCYPNAAIRIPYRIGCGLAGGDWNIVKKIIEESLIANNIDVEIWKFDK